jgi:hypothetical protein
MYLYSCWYFLIGIMYLSIYWYFLFGNVYLLVLFIWFILCYDIYKIFSSRIIELVNLLKFEFWRLIKCLVWLSINKCILKIEKFCKKVE